MLSKHVLELNVGRGAHVLCSLLKPIYPSMIKFLDSLVPWVLPLIRLIRFESTRPVFDSLFHTPTTRYAVWGFGMLVPSFTIRYIWWLVRCVILTDLYWWNMMEAIYIQWNWTEISQSIANELFPCTYIDGIWWRENIFSGIELQTSEVALYPFPIHISIQSSCTLLELRFLETRQQFD